MPDAGQPRELVIRAEPFLPLAVPVYPAAALRAHDAGGLVSVHVTVGPTGNVTDVKPSLFGFTTPGPFAPEFQSAVETAVVQWKFQPAEIQLVEIIREGEGRTSRKITQRRPTEAEFDVAFLFTALGEVVTPKR